MTEVGLADRLELLRLKRAEFSSIVRSRKRKLRELYAVATDTEGALQSTNFDVDAPPSTTGETKFLLDTDILQGRVLSDARIPTRQKPNLETLKPLFASAPTFWINKEIGSDPRQTLTLVNGAPPSPTTKTHNASSTEPSISSRPPSCSNHTPKPEEKNGDTVVPRWSPIRGQSSTSSLSKGEQVDVQSPTITTLPTADLAARRAQHPAASATDTNGGLNRSAEPHGSTLVNGWKRETPDTSAVSFVSRNEDVPYVDRAVAKDGRTPLRPTSDALKACDIPSSPDSTAQTATTPAVHDVSVTTSPENEHNNFVDAGETADRCNSQDKTEDGSLADGSRDVTVEAQLLQESAAAGESRTATNGVPEADSTSELQRPMLAALAAAQPVAAAGVLPHVANVDDVVNGTTTKAAGYETLRIKTAFDSSTKPPRASSTEEADVPVLNRPNDRVVLYRGLTSPSNSAALPTPKPSTGDATENRYLGDYVAATRRKTKRRAPTVLLGKQKKARSETTVVPSILTKSENLYAEDYFTPLFVQTFASNSKWLKNLDQLVHHAHKTVSSADSQASIFDNQSCKILKRVYHLQQQDKWSLRQPKRVPEPPRPKSHWDVMLQEMKWMRTDFREERKWKRSMSRNLANACARWVQATPEDRITLQISASIPPRCDAKLDDLPMIDNAMIDAARCNDEGKNETIAPNLDEVDLVDDGGDWADDILISTTIAPSAIFALEDDAVIFELNPSGASDRLFSELPMFGKPLEVPGNISVSNSEDPDAAWRRPVVPVSKYIDAPLIIKPKKLLKKKSRYAVTDEDGDHDVEEFVDSVSVFDTTARKGAAAPDNIVGLFDPNFKNMRERLLAGHQFRPPSEYAMPMSGFYEYRPPSQWTVADDDQLKKLVREFSYNWSLTASLMASKSDFVSGAERRTPWECFERWVALEGFPSDASRSPYFKIYQARIDAAQKAIKDMNEKAAAAAAAAAASVAKTSNGGNGSAPPASPTPVPRRRPTLPLRVERHRNQKYLATFEAMRKLAKKREAIQHKQQQQAAIVATRKANEPAPQRLPAKTPREYSRMRYERDQKMAERMAEYAQRQNELQRRAVGAGSVNLPPQLAAQMAANNMAMAARPNLPGLPHGSAVRNSQQPRSRMPIQSPVNPSQGLQHMAANGAGHMPMTPVQQAQLQQALQSQHRMQLAQAQAQGNGPDINLVLQARRIQDQQRVVQLQQHHQVQQHQQTHPQQQKQHQQMQQLQQQQLHQQHLQQLQLQQLQQQQQQQALRPQQHTSLSQHTQQASLLTPQQQHALQQQHAHQQQQILLLQQQALQQVQQQQAQQQQPPPLAVAHPHQQGQQGQPGQQGQQVSQGQSQPGTQQAPKPQQGQPTGKILSASQGSPTAVRQMGQQGSFVANAQGMAAPFNVANTAPMGSPGGLGISMAGHMAANSPSPRPTIPPQQLPPNILAQIRELENGFRAKNPSLTPEQARAMAVQNYSQIMMMQRASAMHSAAGGGPQQALAGTSPRQYAQLLRAQQAQQVQQAANGQQHNAPKNAPRAQASPATQAAGSPLLPAGSPLAGSPLLAQQQQSVQVARKVNGNASPSGIAQPTAK
ncbi:RNA polymerase II transcription elongation factor SpEAF [Sporothrix epigloea]|uniref:Vacuolar import and degradation protein 21 n=1 Tax=Sporothrix epigloea TaxID=1892477 RepID=A0ABP0DHZ8_9PEZI